MNTNKLIALAGITLSLMTANGGAQAQPLSANDLSGAAAIEAQTTIFGAANDLRGELVKLLPMAKPITDSQCTDGVCTDVVIGYLAPRPMNLDQYATYDKADSGDTADKLAVHAHAAAASDAATTLVGLAGGAVEANPLMGASPSPVAIVGVTALKMVYVNAMANDTSRTTLEKITDLCGATSVMSAASYNNLAVMAGGVGALPVIIGLAVSQHQYGSCVIEAAAQPTQAEIRENLALAHFIHNMDKAAMGDTELALR